MSISDMTAWLPYSTYMELLGGVDLLVDVFLGLEVDGLEGGLQQRVSLAWMPTKEAIEDTP